MHMQKNVLITGCSSGIGLATAKNFLLEDYIVVATFRNISTAKTLMDFADSMHRKNSLYTFELDVNSGSSVSRFFKLFGQQFDSLDILVNNAGFVFYGATLDSTVEELKDQFETNLFGIHRVTTQAIKYLQKTQGIIITICSISGQITFPLSGIYCASKHAVESYCESLWMELTPLQIKQYIVEPGAISTQFFSKSLRFTKSQRFTNLYKNKSRDHKVTFGGRTNWRTDPQVVAQKILEIAKIRPFRFRHFVGRYAFILPLMKKILPTEIFYALLQKMT